MALQQQMREAVRAEYADPMAPESDQDAAADAAYAVVEPLLRKAYEALGRELVTVCGSDRSDFSDPCVVCARNRALLTEIKQALGEGFGGDDMPGEDELDEAILGAARHPRPLVEVLRDYPSPVRTFQQRFVAVEDTQVVTHNLESRDVYVNHNFYEVTDMNQVTLYGLVPDKEYLVQVEAQ